MCTFVISLIASVCCWFRQVSDKLSQLKGQFEEKMKEREMEYQAKIDEITANKNQGLWDVSAVIWTVKNLYIKRYTMKVNSLLPVAKSTQIINTVKIDLLQ